MRDIRHLVFKNWILFWVMTAAACPIALAQLNAPAHLRADIADGNNGQLLISWDKVSGSAYYNLQYSTSPSSGFQNVTNCSGLSSAGYTDTPYETSQMCRQSGLAVTNPPTTYYYQVAACNSSNVCSTYTSPPVSNSPVSCSCTISQIPSMVVTNGQNVGQNIIPPAVERFKTSVVTNGNASYLPDANEMAAAHYSTGNNKLLVYLPGSGSTCDYAAIMYTAQVLGFDTICVNYSNNTEEETICAGNPQCFYAISQAKWNGSGQCIEPEVAYQNCGYDKYTQTQYYNVYYDSVLYRIISMLQYLVANDTTANWQQYLNGTTPIWGSIILSGFSQGGDMATYADGLLNTAGTPIQRAINLSAPPQAVQVPTGSGPYVAASYFAGPPAWFTSTTIRSVYGLVSANDSHYTKYGVNGVFQVVWPAMGFTAANNDEEWDLNCTTSLINMNPDCNYLQQPVTTMQGLNCPPGTPTTPSYNFVNYAATSPQGGHDDTLAIWNQDIYEFMLLD